MDGYNATVRIRRMKDEKKAPIPIIAITANAFADVVYPKTDSQSHRLSDSSWQLQQPLHRWKKYLPVHFRGKMTGKTFPHQWQRKVQHHNAVAYSNTSS